MCECTPLRGPESALKDNPTRSGRSRGPAAVLLAALALASSCVTVPDPVTLHEEDRPVAVPSTIHAVAFSTGGETLYLAAGASRCALNAMNVGTREVSTLRDLAFCPDRLTTFPDGSVLASSSALPASLWVGQDGSTLFEGRTILAALDSTHLLEHTSDGLVWMNGDMSVTIQSPVLRAPRVVAGGGLLSIEAVAEGDRLVRFDGPSATAISPTFEAIDSWDASPGGDEVVFSAKVETGFDIGLVSASGGEVTWVAPDPADERVVTWAPRGNKITYTFESFDATLVRSVHIPTSFQVVFDLPLTVVRHIGWEPRAERFAMVIESPASGSRIDWIGYQGDARDGLLKPADSVDGPVEALFWDAGSGVLLGPETVRYGQTKTTVVWIEERDPFAFRPEVARLRSEGIPVLVTVPGRVGDLRSALGDLPWVSSSRLHVVDVSGEAGPVAEKLEAAAWLSREGSGTPAGAIVVAGDDREFRASAVRRILEMERVDR